MSANETVFTYHIIYASIPVKDRFRNLVRFGCQNAVSEAFRSPTFGLRPNENLAKRTKNVLQNGN